MASASRHIHAKRIISELDLESVDSLEFTGVGSSRRI
jgi:hypothetical protein